MTKIPTREEFDRLVDAVRHMGHIAALTGRFPPSDLDIDPRCALMDAYHKMIERIVELEAQCDTMGTMLLEEGCDGVVHECAVLDARIKELEENDHV